MPAPVSKAQYVYDALRAEIRGGEVTAGSPLRAAAVAERLGVSVTPVREALRRLETDGLVRYQAHHGATVTDLSEEATREFYAVRAAVEGLGARLAAGRVTPEQLDDLRALHAAMEQAWAGGDLDRLAADSERLHLAVTDIGGPAFLGRQARAVRGAYPVPPGASLWLDRDAARHHLDAHARLLDALAAGDGEAAGREMSEHVERAASYRLGSEA